MEIGNAAVIDWQVSCEKNMNYPAASSGVSIGIFIFATAIIYIRRQKANLVPDPLGYP